MEQKSYKRINKVLSGLYIGDEDALDDLDTYNITTVVSIGPEFKDVQYKLMAHHHIDFHLINIVDHESAHIERYFESATKLISNAIINHDNVLVHCQAGVSRSATIVIAYLMINNRMTYTEAHTYLKKIRPCIWPNEGFENKLKELEPK